MTINTSLGIVTTTTTTTSIKLTVTMTITSIISISMTVELQSGAAVLFGGGMESARETDERLQGREQGSVWQTF